MIRASCDGVYYFLSMVKMKIVFIDILILHIGLLYGQSLFADYTHFTPERRQILSKMGEFFDETIRKNFPAKTDTISYLNFGRCILQSSKNGIYILNVDRDKLRKINQVLFKDQNYYFFYVRYFYTWNKLSESESYADSVPTIQDNNPPSKVFRGLWWLFGDILNRDGYIKVLPKNNPAIHVFKEDLERAGSFSPGIFSENVLLLNVREVSQPVVKELCAVVFWQYLCASGGIDLIGRRPFCESCNL